MRSMHGFLESLTKIIWYKNFRTMCMVLLLLGFGCCFLPFFFLLPKKVVPNLSLENNLSIFIRTFSISHIRMTNLYKFTTFSVLGNIFLLRKKKTFSFFLLSKRFFKSSDFITQKYFFNLQNIIVCPFKWLLIIAETNI